MNPKLIKRAGVWHLQCGLTCWPFSSREEAVSNIPRIVEHEKVAVARVEAAKAAARKARDHAAACAANDTPGSNFCAYQYCQRRREEEVPGLGGFCKFHADNARWVLAHPEEAKQREQEKILRRREARRAKVHARVA